ncbi:hypothetical protein WJX84_001867 [Apatococcus fuscideae]|uniref:ER membrane protein complex subunit 1 C-terminal domain-containing protein n=1 Tax=Apatococcus fuscideae TaxID=2026836 RepID=A0AAW1SL06_9CHLO
MGKPTAQDMEERLAPYQELLPLIPQAAITMDKQVARLSGILNDVAHLESTAMFLAMVGPFLPPEWQFLYL